MPAPAESNFEFTSVGRKSPRPETPLVAPGPCRYSSRMRPICFSSAFRLARRPAVAGSILGFSLSCSPTSAANARSEEHTSELQSLMRISYAVFCLQNKNHQLTPCLRLRNLTHRQHFLQPHHSTIINT